MVTIGCPRCRGLLVPTFGETEPVRCVNCGGRFTYERLSAVQVAPTQPAQHCRKSKSIGSASKQPTR